jgi:hypothetical protein
MKSASDDRYRALGGSARRLGILHQAEANILWRTLATEK